MKSAWRTLLITSLVMTAFLAAPASGESFLVKDGRPLAEVVVAEKPPRMAKLAGEEFQAYVEKITGAKLPVVTAPTPGVAVEVYIGKSPFTDKLKISDEGLQYGAFKMVSGENWLVLLGHDEDFTPPEPYAYNNTSIPELLKKWDAITGDTFGCPVAPLYKGYNRELQWWSTDQRGSLNAVYAFVRMQGVRWYMPGEFGEFCPKNASIALPKVDKTVRPDFPVRNFAQYGQQFATTTRDEILWQMRLGLDGGWDIIGPSLGHGIQQVIEREETKAKHPEYYALIGGKRATTGRLAPCLSSEGLFQANLKYARAVFDTYHAPQISVMPTDGFASLCQCELCAGKGTPERGNDGFLSDYVWGYVERVARELYKTHPDRKVHCFAYTTYALPPTKIDKFSPNVAVGICQGRRWLYDEERFQRLVQLRQDWLAKTSNPLNIFEYYNHARPNKDQLPVVFTHIIGRDLRSLKGISLGEYVEVFRQRDDQNRSLALNHLNMYVTAQCYWDANLDVDALLEEYYTNFYGPARTEMKAFIEFAEKHWMNLAKSKEEIDAFFVLLDKARQAAGDGLYGKRIDLIAQSVQPIKEVREKLSIGRDNAYQAIATRCDARDIVVDGKLDDPFWEKARAYDLRDLVSGKPTPFRTSFKIGCADKSVYFGIRCDEPDMANLNIGATKDGDQNIWSGDNIEILIETQSHAYYQFAISPTGALVDVDRKDGINTLWNSGAKVVASRGADYWSLEVQIPLVDELQAVVDVNNGFVGRQPTVAYPWYFNVCRQRLREKDAAHSAFSPTGQKTFHDRMKFAKMMVK